MRVEFTEPALRELEDAIEFYNFQAKGLGGKFLDEVLETIELITRFPKLWSFHSVNTRKAVLRKFPFYLIYSELKDRIFIIAVAHQNREPEYWINRI